MDPAVSLSLSSFSVVCGLQDQPPPVNPAARCQPWGPAEPPTPGQALGGEARPELNFSAEDLRWVGFLQIHAERIWAVSRTRFSPSPREFFREALRVSFPFLFTEVRQRFLKAIACF